MNFKLLLLAIILILISGCASTPKYSISNDWDKTKLSRLFIYRTDVVYHSLDPEEPFFYIDGKEVGTLGTGQSISTVVIPGNHTIVVKGPILFMPGFETGNLQFTAEPNKEYYIRYSEDFTGVLITSSTPVATGTSTLQMANKKYYLERK